MRLSAILTLALAASAWATPHEPPIDCPLRKHGVDHKHMEPFEDTARYIEMLEREDRAAWQRPEAVIEALKLKGGEVVLDIGAGSGYFAFRFAKALPRGRVIAADVRPEMVRHVHHKVMTEQIANVEAALIKHDDPGGSAAVDLIFICNVLHHVEDRPAWLARLAAETKPGARLALLEFREGPLPEGPPEGMKIPQARLIALAEGAGFELVEALPKLLPYQTMLVFKRR